MKKLELEQLRKDINARIDAIINTVINQKEGFWCKSNKLPIYIHKSGIEDGKYATIINPMQAKLEEAKLKYVNGTEFKSVDLGNREFTVHSGVKIGVEHTNKIFALDLNGVCCGTIYNGDTDTWAEIIPQDKGAVLIEQAKKMGFKEGVHIDNGNLVGMSENRTKLYPLTNEFEYCPDSDMLYCITTNGNRWSIYHRDKWATIIQEPIIIDGKEVDVSPTGCTIKGVAFHKYQIKTLQSLNPIFTEILKRMEEKNG